MIKYLLIAAFIFVLSFISAQSIEGAWKWRGQNEGGQAIVATVIFMDGFQVASLYNEVNPEFISTNGGKYWYETGVLTEVVEFHSKHPDMVGDTVMLEIEFKDDNTVYFPVQNTTLKRLDGGTPGVLAGSWLFSGRKLNGKIQNRDTSNPRKTMKLLSGTRFQWIAFNTETGQFFGTGGGTYSTNDGKYIESIEFFSRDDSRVGASLELDFEIKDGTWHHSGNNSRGELMYEFWSRRTK